MIRKKNDSTAMSKSLRLQLFLAKAGIGSRRACEQIIKNGRVKVNGKIIKTMGTKVSPEDTILLDGQKVHVIKKKIYLVLNKPRGYLSSNFDPFGRPIILDLIKDKISTRVYHVGRLDFDSSGLIFLTNDGQFSKMISHPRYNIEKEYLVETSLEIPERILKLYIRGIDIAGTRYSLVRYEKLSKKKVMLVLMEGKNRELRRFFEYFHIPVKRIHRIRIGIVTVKGISAGKFRQLNKDEVKWYLNKAQRINSSDHND
jgi:23S rRNA pseudouridine2605 synthase